MLVGAGTARGEGYGPPGKRGLRVGVVTNSGALDLSRPLFTSGAGFLIVPDAADVDGSAVDVLRAGAEHVDLALALARLDSIVPGVRVVQAEGGPTLNAALLAADAVDELNLTISPRHGRRRQPAASCTARAALDARFDARPPARRRRAFVFGRWVRAGDGRQ